ncbi:hypothetical protein NH340_JMT05694 [Sarcoptes scabiei]|nr:hypothetical protein NH340_JMT05694 [Sarcoptes scabiei]
MNNLIIFCENCYQSALFSKEKISFYLTSCGKIFCHNCQCFVSVCEKCGTNCAKKLISNNMEFQVKIFFKDCQSLSKKIYSIYCFQMNRYNLIIKHLLKQIIETKALTDKKNRSCRILRDEIQALEQKYLKLSSDIKKSTSIVNNRCDTREIPFMSRMIRAVEERVDQDLNEETSFLSGIGPSFLPLKQNLDNSNSWKNNSLTRDGYSKSIVAKAYPIRKILNGNNNAEMSNLKKTIQISDTSILFPKINRFDFSYN